MFTHSILATDLSGAADQVVANLGGLIPLGAKEITVAHCLSLPPPGAANTGYELNDALHDDLHLRAEKRLEALRSRLEMQGFATTSRILYGKPAPALAELSGEIGAGLLILGSRGASLAKNIMLGSSAMDILRLSPIPVFLKRLEVKDFSGQRHYRLICRDFASHILYATDFSETAERAFQYLLRIVEASQAAVTLLHVSTKKETEMEQEAKKRLIEMGARLQEAGAQRVQVKVPHGDPAEMITKEASITDISLLIMGTQGKAFVEEFFLGSESQTVIRSANIPILMIPPLAKIEPGPTPRAVPLL